MEWDLVTGGAGFIGSHLVDELLRQGRKVRVVDNFASGHPRNLEHQRGNRALEVIEGDVADQKHMLAVTEGVDRVFHLAAMADIVPSIQKPDAYFRSNVDGTYAVCEAARAHQVRRFVYVASSSCYGIPEVYPTPEDTRPDARYPYALTKWLGENVVMHWAKIYGLPAVSVRFFNIYGPRARTSGAYGAVFGVFLAQLLAGKPLTIVGNGEQSRDFTYVSDAADALITAASSSVCGEIYNVGTSRPVTVNEIVRLLGAKETIYIPKRPGEPDCTWADTSRIQRDLGWTPKVPIEVGVAKMLENIEYWREAPVWTPDSIREATADWFKYLR
ncbi:MAG: SDR family oxidoreductase [Alphaproteobacteria bacterium]|nr:SDR family oxidoreductase [Alphaproteobacteria bacterium]